ncbi:MAG: bifunctional metallophosphatase/5'-nucleotidase [Rheinheimera sp.]|uniref:bifunctional metallophosphatase/5'-nucleotidase n=1 Tax=Arsukibacterium sp. UBA3155 TaxID=1946058 RepID=UPI000C8A181D|nr:bifunctional metallophosphatase/5'-nucleotidase [Arsukibacterium sp. UBA3155]MAD77039.1 bifunctional metallophosphatase/5'-nucleotidase [Rheinheimera sp.]|tara:strand:- start:14697 stop:16709 length:2013 start_codon:yes stop_codon:yes gene_type:complete
MSFFQRVITLLTALSACIVIKGCTSQLTTDTDTSSDDSLHLTLVHINDTHSQFDATPASVLGPDGDPLYTFIGGHPRLLTKAQQLQGEATASGVPSLFLHGGDAFKGSAYFELFEQKINIDILNRMGLDAMALGNHEFDIGLAKLADFAANINFPLLAANVDTQAEPALAAISNLKGYQLFAVAGTRLTPVANVAEAAGQTMIAVFGLALEDMRSMVPATGELVFAAEVASAQATVDYLQDKGINHIIALTHLGHQRDLTLARQVNGIDVIVGGHSHSLLGDFTQWYLGQQAPYAGMITNPDGKGQTCIVQAGQFAQAVGAAKLQFDAAGRLRQCQGENTLLASRDYYTLALRNEHSRIASGKQASMERYIDQLNRTAITEEDQALRQVLDTVYLPAVQQAYGEQISVTEQTINHVRLPGTAGSDQHGSVLAGHVTDAMHYWLNQPAVRAKTGREVDFTLIGAGNIRADLNAGAIFEGHIRLEVLPFDTPLSILTVTGKELCELLQQVITATLPEGAHAGKFPYSSHLRYIAREDNNGQAVLDQLQWLQGERWQDIEPDTTYSLATTNYLANGNDGWQRLQQVQQQSTDRIDVIIEQQQVAIYPLSKVEAITDSSGQQAFVPHYQQAAGLPCKIPGNDCKVAAAAMIDYLKATPALWQQERVPTVTLLRR